MILSSWMEKEEKGEKKGDRGRKFRATDKRSDDTSAHSQQVPCDIRQCVCGTSSRHTSRIRLNGNSSEEVEEGEEVEGCKEDKVEDNREGKVSVAGSNKCPLGLIRPELGCRSTRNVGSPSPGPHSTQSPACKGTASGRWGCTFRGPGSSPSRSDLKEARCSARNRDDRLQTVQAVGTKAVAAEPGKTAAQRLELKPFL